VTPEINTSVAHPARVYDYWLGGKDNFPADREAAEEVAEALPTIKRSARANRAFMVRAVRYLAAEAGIRQFLDIGTGIPTSPNVHEVAQEIAPDARIVYVDNDPIVLVHARALLTSHPDGRTDYLDADVRDPDKILEGAAATLDFRRPVALLLVATLQYVADADDPHGIVARLRAALAPGSYLVISHPTRDVQPERIAEAAKVMNRLLAAPYTPRTREEITRFFDGLELLPPGVVQTTAWRPDPGDDDLGGKATMLCGVARKP
jgi:SAM-dependent methyltransferase